jgi:UDP-N-acetylglucosamine 2-epimerase (non-hydrolysing)
VLATIHRADNTDDRGRLEHILDALGALDRTVVLPVHPRLRVRAEADGIQIARGNLVTIDPLAYPDMVNTVIHAAGVITDSGGLQKEAFLLRTVCTTVRTETEWTETVDNGWNTLDPNAEHLDATAVRPAPAGDPGHPYGDGHAASRVAEVLAGARTPDRD